MPSSYPQNAGKRLLTIVGAAALGVAAFASPVVAQTPVPTEVFVEDYSPITVGDTPEKFGTRIEFGDDFEEGVHTVSATITIDAPDNTFEIGLPDGSGSDCPFNEAHTVISCEQANADAATHFQFRYAAVLEAEPGTYDYTVEFKVDGETVETVEDSIEVSVHSVESFRYGSADIEIEPGDTYDSGPGFIQTAPLPEGTVALAYGVSEPSYILSGLADVSAPYENCVDGYWNGDGGVTCIVTDIQDAPGTTFAPDAPISFSVGETVPGPIDLCGCGFEVRPLTAEELEAEYGDVDTETGDQLGFAVVSESDDPDDFNWHGPINVRTTENPFDLAVSDANAKGDKGDQVTLTVPVKSLGPADAASFYDGPGSYGIIGALPKGLELVKIDSDGDDIFCFEPDDPTVENSFPQVDPAKTDFVCIFSQIDAGAQIDFKFTVKITDANANAKGSLEIAAIDYEGYPGIADADSKNNIADITVNGNGSAQLPKTGTSLTMVIGIAALVLVAGVVMMVLTARRRKAVTGGATEE